MMDIKKVCVHAVCVEVPSIDGFSPSPAVCHLLSVTKKERLLFKCGSIYSFCVCIRMYLIYLFFLKVTMKSKSTILFFNGILQYIL